MSARARVVLLGLDALDPPTALRMAHEGRMPSLHGLLSRAARCTVINPYGLYVGTLWATLFTARSPARANFHCWEEIAAGTYELRPTSVEDLDGRPFWNQLSDAGRRVAVVDVPHSRVIDPVNGVQISEYGCHDRHLGFRTWPPELAGDIVEQYGLHPVLTNDPWSVREFAPDDYAHRAAAHRTAEEESELLGGLLAGAEAKSRLSVDLLAGDQWDLFLSVFGESHAVGHQSWHLHDPAHPRHHPALAAELGDPVAQVYERLDGALGRHLELVDVSTRVLVLLSHGMGAHNDGTHLFPEILRRLDCARDGRLQRSIPGRALGATWRRAPAFAQSRGRAPVAGMLRRRLSSRAPTVVSDVVSTEERRRQRFFLSPNNYTVGGVRFNLVGREEQGRVGCGAELDALCRWLANELLMLVNVETGDAVVRRVERTDDHYRRRPLDALPDMLVEWNQEAPIETVWSPTIGVVHAPYTHWRTGDHRPDGMLLVAGPGVEAGAEMPPLDIINLAPSLSAYMGHALCDVDGRAVPWLS